MGVGSKMFPGFQIIHVCGDTHINFKMPEQLKETFYVTLYLKNEINDFSGGDQEVIWDKLSHRYNDKKLVAPVQVHGVEIIDAVEENALPIKPKADGIYVNSKTDCCFSLRFADCVPVVIAGANPSPWMFFLHSGFMGTVQGITNSAFSFLNKKHKNLEAVSLQESVWAWIGPSICTDCYYRSVSDKNYKTAISSFDKRNVTHKNNFIFFNLAGQIKKQLLENGMKEENIYKFKECTKCNAERYYSYRAGEKNKRLFLLGNCATNKS